MACVLPQASETIGSKFSLVANVNVRDRRLRVKKNSQTRKTLMHVIADKTDNPDPVVLAQALVQVVGNAVQGKESQVQLAVTALLARGHLLIEDVPGVGKTSLARAIARAIGLRFSRVQLTSDLMPSDIVGASVYNPKEGSFDFRPGPIFTNFLLADELNRTPPKTQSALLEAMAESHVSVDGVTRPLERPFFVVATQNPLESHGTFPLPESQLDRFMLRLRLGYPDPNVEAQLLTSRGAEDPVSAITPIMERSELIAAQDALANVTIHADVAKYLHALVIATRQDPRVRLGVSTRAALTFVQATKAFAMIHGRDYVIADDVVALAEPALAHRLLLGDSDATEAKSAIVREMLDVIAVPT